MSHMGVRASVRRRAKGRCELCGEKVVHGQQSLHHRKMKRLGGQDTVQNLLFTHRSCHDEVHRDETYAGHKGWVAWGFAEITPLWLRRDRWVMLTNTGEYEELPEDDAAEFMAWLEEMAPPQLLDQRSSHERSNAA